MTNKQELIVGSDDWEVAHAQAVMRGCKPEIRLTPANEALKAAFVSRAEEALFGSDSPAITVESCDTTDNFHLGRTKFLSRVALLDLPSSTVASTDRQFHLALSTRSMHLTANQVKSMTTEEIESCGYDRFDGVYAELLDVSLRNYVQKSLHHGSRDSRYGFRFYEFDTGYGHVLSPKGDITHDTYQIEVGYYDTRGYPRIGSHLEELQVMVEVLEHGVPHQSAMSRLLHLTQEDDNVISLVTEDVSEKTLPYFYGMLKDAAEAPSFRDEIALHQYHYYTKGPAYLVS